MDLLLSGGIVLLIIVLISVYAVYLFFTRLFKISRERMDVDALMQKVNSAVLNRNLESAVAVTKEHGGPVGRVLHKALTRIPYGRPAVEAAFQEGLIEEEQNLSHGLRALSTIAQLGPLLGLLGTVTGMIIAFGELANLNIGNPEALAGGIGQALVTTAAGLILAIPALIGHNYLASRVDRMLTEIERRREELMGNVVQVVLDRREEKRAVRPVQAAG